MIQFGGINLINVDSFTELLLRLTLNILVMLVLVGWLYYSKTKRKDYLFTYMLIGTIIFLLCFMLSNVELEMGFTLGMFAVFGIIRYRTDSIPIKEMTYLLIIIGLSVINALSGNKLSYVELIFTNLIIVIITFIFEKVWLHKNESAKIIRYEKIELIKPENRELLLADLRERTGIVKINRIEIGKIDFLRDTASIIIYYYEDKLINQADIMASRPRDDDDDD